MSSLQYKHGSLSIQHESQPKSLKHSFLMSGRYFRPQSIKAKLIKPFSFQAKSSKTDTYVKTPQSSVTPSLLRLLNEADKDNDGKLTIEEVHELFHQYEQRALAPKAPVKPPTWEIGFLNGWKEAQSRGTLATLGAVTQRKLANGRQVLRSDVFWSSVGMFLTMVALGLISERSKQLPIAGPWHKAGLGVMIGSFGTLSTLLFARPESEPIRVWNFVLGHLLTIATAMLAVHLPVPVVVSRALAMAVSLALMLVTDSVHPPGAALVMLFVDSPAAQGMGGWFLLYPSVVLTVLVLVPIAIATSWLKRNVKFGGGELDKVVDGPHAAPKKQH